jgi:diguanylate cyclase (GGDEF)-like protein
MTDMDWMLTLAGGILFSVTAMALVVSWFMWNRRAFAGGSLLFLLLMAVAGYALVAGLEATFVTLRWKILWSTLEYIGSGSVATLFLMFVARYSGYDRWAHGWLRVAVWSVPSAAFVLVVTNALHHWVWRGFMPGPAGSNAVIYIHGPGFYAIIAALYTYVIVACALLLRSVTQPVVIRHKQSAMLLFGTLFPLAGGILYALGISPIEGLNLIPISFFFTGIVLFVGVGPFRVLHLVPVARDTLVEGMPDAVFVLDTKWRLIDLNPAARRLLDLDGSVIGRSIEEIPAVWDRIRGYCHGGDGGRVEFALTEAPLCYVDIRVSPLSGPDRRPSGYLITIHDITKRHVAEAELQRANQRLESQIEKVEALQVELREQASSDVLTGLFNRRRLDEVLPRELKRAQHDGGVVSVILFDIDHFKQVNDRYGHETGDRLIQALAQLLRERTRPGDIACRYGGDEFLLVLPETPLDAAAARADEIRVAFSCLSPRVVPEGGSGETVSLSAGVAACPNHALTEDAVIKSADEAMYAAKEAGRNRVHVAAL